MTTTKRDLGLQAADKLDSTKSFSYKAVDCLFKAMRDILIAGDRIEVRGFGVLGTKNTKPKPSARNPRTGEIVPVPARRKVYFRMGKKLKEGLNPEQPSEEEG